MLRAALLRLRLICPWRRYKVPFWETLLPDWRLGRRVLDLCHRDTKDQSQRDSAAQPERNRAQPQCVQINPAVAGHALQN